MMFPRNAPMHRLPNFSLSRPKNLCLTFSGSNYICLLSLSDPPDASRVITSLFQTEQGYSAILKVSVLGKFCHFAITLEKYK